MIQARRHRQNNGGALHSQSPERAIGRLLRLMRAIPEALLESELFGYRPLSPARSTRNADNLKKPTAARFFWMRSAS
ncbi:MAG: hypothetical protein WKF30_08975 [Pyrinomonadaceae bacterium]